MNSSVLQQVPLLRKQLFYFVVQVLNAPVIYARPLGCAQWFCGRPSTLPEVLACVGASTSSCRCSSKVLIYVLTLSEF